MIEFKAEEGWEQVETTTDNLWYPEKEGEGIQGIYTQKREGVGRNHATVYRIKNGEGEFLVFGTVALVNAFKQIPLGYEVGIIYRGEKPSTPPKKPYKLFDVFKRPVKRESRPEISQSETKTSDAVDKKEDEKTPFEMNEKDDPEARQLIEEATDILISEHKPPRRDKDIVKQLKKMEHEDPGSVPFPMIKRVEEQLKRRN